LKLRPLILDGNSRAEIKRVIDYADGHRYNLHDVMAVIKGNRPPPGDTPQYTCVVPLGYRCVFTFEQQPKGWCRHFSVSVLGDGQAPSPAAVLALAKEFGYEVNRGYQIDHEPFGPGKIAINVWQLIEPDDKVQP
jgi:hypothetical protein